MDWQYDLTGFLARAEHPLIVVLGPTAGGKTAFSIALAQAVGSEGKIAEIINADSRQLYRHLTIGTAKITPGEMRGIPHHLFDVLDPREEASAGWYQHEAQEAIGQIHGRGAIPVLAGGSMLYISSVIDDLTLGPAPDCALRAQLIEAYEKDGGRTLYARLQEIDPEAAAGIHPHNMPYLVRALEISALLKEPKSRAVPRTELRSADASSPYDLLLFGMRWERNVLCKRIDERTEKMFADGWMEEVKDLLKLGYTSDDPGMRSHGYREIIAFLGKESGDTALLRETIAAKARQYARRQMTWWKGDGRIRWLDAAVLPKPTRLPSFSQKIRSV